MNTYTVRFKGGDRVKIEADYIYCDGSSYRFMVAPASSRAATTVAAVPKEIVSQVSHNGLYLHVAPSGPRRRV